MRNTICSVWNSTNNILGYSYLNSLKCHYTKQPLEKQFENPRTYVPFAIADIIKSKAKNNESKRRKKKKKRTASEKYKENVHPDEGNC